MTTLFDIILEAKKITKDDLQSIEDIKAYEAAKTRGKKGKAYNLIMSMQGGKVSSVAIYTALAMLAKNTRMKVEDILNIIGNKDLMGSDLFDEINQAPPEDIEELKDLAIAISEKISKVGKKKGKTSVSASDVIERVKNMIKARRSKNTKLAHQLTDVQLSRIITTLKNSTSFIADELYNYLNDNVEGNQETVDLFQIKNILNHKTDDNETTYAFLSKLLGFEQFISNTQSLPDLLNTAITLMDMIDDEESDRLSEEARQHIGELEKINSKQVLIWPETNSDIASIDGFDKYLDQLKKERTRHKKLIDKYNTRLERREEQEAKEKEKVDKKKARQEKAGDSPYDQAYNMVVDAVEKSAEENPGLLRAASGAESGQEKTLDRFVNRLTNSLMKKQTVSSSMKGPHEVREIILKELEGLA